MKKEEKGNKVLLIAVTLAVVFFLALFYNKEPSVCTADKCFEVELAKTNDEHNAADGFFSTARRYMGCIDLLP